MKLLDLFCGGGGAAMGYSQAGFDYIVGVDIRPQPHYPFQFVQGDALEYALAHGKDFDAIHASPPCQRYSSATPPDKRDRHPDLIAPTREALQQTGKHYIIENVDGAPLLNPVRIVGTMFGLLVWRPRLFECSFDVPFFLVPPRHAKQTKMGRPPKEGEFIHVVGHYSGAEYAKKAMGVDWMVKSELAEAIPPAYTKFLGNFLLGALRTPANNGLQPTPKGAAQNSLFN